MFRVLICDDENFTCSYIEQVLLDYAEKEDINIISEVCCTGEGLLQYMKQNSNVDMLFLDIELPGMNGTEVGNVLRNELKNENVQIVFISSYDSYAMQLFQVRPFDFLIKPLKEDAIIDIFKKYRRIFGNDRKFFTYKTGRHEEKILLSEIMYFKCEYRKICIVTNNKKILYYGNIKEVHESIPSPDFWSVHNSYIINSKHVKQFLENKIVMSDDTVIPVSHAYKNEVNRKTMHLHL